MVIFFYCVNVRCGNFDLVLANRVCLAGFGAVAVGDGDLVYFRDPYGNGNRWG